MGNAQRKRPAPAGTGGKAQYQNATSSLNHNSPPIEKLLNRLDGVRSAGRDQWMASAPTREGRDPSLAIRALPDGRILIHDFGGDEPGDILAAIGLSMADLFPDHGRDHARRVSPGQRWNYRDLIKTLRRETTLICICAHDLANNRPLAESDRQRLIRAAQRVYRVAEVAE